MSFPNIPNVDPDITLSWDQSVSLLLASIAFEQLGLSHIINAEGEKIQYALGTLGGQKPPVPASIDQVLEINESVSCLLKQINGNQIQLQNKLEHILKYANYDVHVNTGTATGLFDDTAVSASDKAYYFTIGGCR